MAKYDRLLYEARMHGYNIYTVRTMDLYVLTSLQTKKVVRVVPPDDRGMPALLTRKEIQAFIDKRKEGKNE